MRRDRGGAWACLLVAIAAATARGGAIPPQPVDGKIAWVYDLDEGRRLARETGRPMFVVFRCER